MTDDEVFVARLARGWTYHPPNSPKYDLPGLPSAYLARWNHGVWRDENGFTLDQWCICGALRGEGCLDDHSEVVMVAKDMDGTVTRIEQGGKVLYDHKRDSVEEARKDPIVAVFLRT